MIFSWDCYGWESPPIYLVVFQPRFHAPMEGTKVGPHFFHPSKLIHRQHAMQFALSLSLTCSLICKGFFFTKVSGFQVLSVLQILGSKQLPLLNKFWVMGITDSRALPMDFVWGNPWCWGLQYSRTEGGDEGLGNRGWSLRSKGMPFWKGRGLGRSWESRVELEEVQSVKDKKAFPGAWIVPNI